MSKASPDRVHSVPASRTTALNAASIVAFAPLGVAVRIGLDNWFAACPDDPEGVNMGDPCITSSGSDAYGGALFTSLPANMLACLLMGLIVPAKVVDTEADGLQAVALLPITWSVQQYAPLWIGIRTGFLGSLSTFASWNLQLVQMICNASISPIGGQIPAALFGYAIGALLSTSMLAVGIHVSEAVYMQSKGRRPGGRAGGPAASPRINDAQDPSAGGVTSKPADDAGFALPAAAEHLAIELASHESATGRDTSPEAEAALSPVKMVNTLAGDDHAVAVPCTDENGLGVEAGTGLGPPVDVVGHEPQPLQAEEPACAGPLDLVILFAALGVAAAAAATAATAPRFRPEAISCLIAPLGAGLRWVLGRYNGRWRRLPWFSLGTLIANVVAATLDGILKGTSVHLDFLSKGSFSSTQGGVAIQVLIDGFMGSLSTVSTLAMEAYNLLEDRSLMRLSAYGYFLATMIVSLAFGVITYGPFIWSLPDEYHRSFT